MTMKPPSMSSVHSPWPVTPANAQHVGTRDSQQDAFGFSNFSNLEFAKHGGYMAVLADGMGGGENGVWASSQAVRAFIHAYQAKTPMESSSEALSRSVSVANGVVYNEAKRLRLLDRMGTTLVAAVVKEQELHWVSVGDSRVYLFEAGCLRCLSTDHNFSEVLKKQVANGEISQKEAQSHPLRNALTSYLGRPEPLQIDASREPLRILSGSWVLLCSDGLSGVLSLFDIENNLRGNPQRACDRLVREALKKGVGNQDNTTVAVLYIPEQGQVSYAHSTNKAISRMKNFEGASSWRAWVLGLLSTLVVGIGIGGVGGVYYYTSRGAIIAGSIPITISHDAASTEKEQPQLGYEGRQPVIAPSSPSVSSGKPLAVASPQSSSSGAAGLPISSTKVKKQAKVEVEEEKVDELTQDNPEENVTSAKK